MIIQAILAKIRTISKSHVVHPGLKVFRDLNPDHEIKLSKGDVPGLGELFFAICSFSELLMPFLAESGWDPALDEV